MKVEDKTDHPFTAAPSYTPLYQRLHFMIGNLSRVDVRLNAADKKPFCNWFDPDQDFILRANKLPLYGASFFPLLYVMLKGWAHVGKQFTTVKNAEEIDELMELQTSL